MQKLSQRFHALVIFSALSAACGWAQDADPNLLQIHVDQAASVAVANNPTVVEAQTQWLIKQKLEGAAWGDFEPALVSSYAESGLDRLNNAAEQVSEWGRTEYDETKSQFDVGLEGKFLTGASYRLGYTLSRTDSVFTNGDEYESTVGLNIEQPLLKGASHRSPLASLRIARLEAQIAFHTFRKQLISIVSSVESAYWDLALAQERRQLAGESVGIATEILTDARERVQVGKISELDLQEAEIQLSIRQAELEDRRQDELETATRLQLLMADKKLGVASGIAAADPLFPQGWDPQRFAVESRDLRNTALSLQPEIAIKQAELEKETIRFEYSRDQQLPELNAKASYGLQGLGSTVDSALQRLNSQGYPNWSVGVELRIPTFGDIKGRNTEEAARLSKSLAQSQLTSAQREITLSVEALVRRVTSYGRQTESARAEAGFRKQLLDVEMTRFNAGQSDVRKLYELEDSLSQARAREMQSYNRLRKALLDLSATSGTILKDRGWETIRGTSILLSRELLKKKG
jgi:outer membrane protein